MADDPAPAPAPVAPPTASSPPAPKAADPREAKAAALVRGWRDEHIANGPIARAVECWNHLEAALQHLAAAILKEF